MLKNLPAKYIEVCLRIINQSFQLSLIPESWKKAIIIPIAKPDKDLTAASSYRPISLLPCFAKLVEKLISSRLTFHLENNNLLSRNQGGFRRKMNTQYQAAIYEHSVRAALQSKKICLAVFIDLSSAYDLVWHTGLLYKLAMCKVEGRMLRWIAEYLRDRKFQVFHEGTYSTERDITSGVPQGAVVSPILFNIMMSDLPSTEDVKNIVYADDLLIYTLGDDINEITEKLQLQINAISNWAKLWGFQINLKKTKAMYHTLKRIKPVNLKLDGKEIPYTKTHKYLGITFDGPRLNWQEHVLQLKIKCIPHINIMKYIGHSSWGADRTILLRYYVAVIRTKLDYGCIFYGTANKTLLQSLNIIQNSCIRIAIGARKTSPISSIEIESNVMPLALHRQYIMCVCYFRIKELPTSVEVVEVINADNVDTNINNYKAPFRIPPFIVRTIEILNNLNFPQLQSSNSNSLVSPLPPWVDTDKIFKTYFSDLSIRVQSSEQIINLFKYLKNEIYDDFLEIYTDGSKIDVPQISTGAAYVIYENGFNIVQKFKLSPLHSILGAELVAILKALEYVKNNCHYINKKGIVIYTDSLSGVSLLKNMKLLSYSELVYNIHKLIVEIRNKYPIVVQYIPAHNGIKGNEMADKLAKESHSNEDILEIPISKIDCKRKLWSNLIYKWQNDWLQLVNTSNKGKFIINVRNKIGYWPWSSHSNRRVETALCRLRIGHAGLNKHLNRFNLSETSLCECGEEETISHYFLTCQLNDRQRSEMINSLNYLHVPLLLTNILGGGNYDCMIQCEIINITAKYLCDTSKISII